MSSAAWRFSTVCSEHAPAGETFGRTLALDGRAGCRPADEPQWWSATWPRARRGTRLPGRAASAVGALPPYIRLDAESDADVRLATPAAAPWPAIVAL